MDEAGWGVSDFQRGLDQLRDSWGPFWDRFADGWNSFKLGWADFTAGLDMLWDAIWEIGENIATIFDFIGDTMLLMGRTTLGVLDVIFGAIDWLVEKIDDLRGRLTDIVDTVTSLPGFGALGPATAGVGAIVDLFRADGGPVMGSRPYIVGERGPELFVPGVSGSIVPNHALGGGMVVHQHFEGVPIAAQLEQANRRLANTLVASGVGG
jgi:hypothetical protein